MNNNRPLSWQKIRHLLNAAGVLSDGWQIGAKRDSDAIAVVTWTGEKLPGKRRLAKLQKALEKNGIPFRLQDDSKGFAIPRPA